MGREASSMPALKAVSDENGGAHRELNSYTTAWLGKHPSALETFEKMIGGAEGKEIVVFLDYDGTLSPIVNDPNKAFMSSSMRSAVKQVADLFPTAIVTGRSLDKVSGFVELKNVVYAGSHGMDILTPSACLNHEGRRSRHEFKTTDAKGNEIIHFQPAQEFLPTIQEIIKVLKEKIKHIKGAMVEDNKFCLSVHFRCVNVEFVHALQEIVHTTMEAYPNFRISWGKKVMEIRPRISWDKGCALEYLLKTFGYNTSTDFLPMYIGDDNTDEDAFKVIRNLGRGYPIIVSSIPKETMALYSLRDPNEVMAFLKRLAKWKKGSVDGFN